MIKSFEVIRPVDFPYRLVNFTFFFNNANTHIMNMHHAAGMDFIYEQMRMCYLFPQNEFYELLKLQNTQEPHDAKYNWILMKGAFGGDPAFDADLIIENGYEAQTLLYPPHDAITKRLFLYRLPEPGNDIVISGKGTVKSFHHFQCNEVSVAGAGQQPAIHVIYLNAYGSLRDIINVWFTKENEQLLLTDKLN